MPFFRQPGVLVTTGSSRCAALKNSELCHAEEFERSPEEIVAFRVSRSDAAKRQISTFSVVTRSARASRIPLGLPDRLRPRSLPRIRCGQASLFRANGKMQRRANESPSGVQGGSCRAAFSSVSSWRAETSARVSTPARGPRIVGQGKTIRPIAVKSIKKERAAAVAFLSP